MDACVTKKKKRASTLQRNGLLQVSKKTWLQLPRKRVFVFFGKSNRRVRHQKKKKSIDLAAKRSSASFEEDLAPTATKEGQRISGKIKWMRSSTKIIKEHRPCSETVFCKFR